MCPYSIRFSAFTSIVYISATPKIMYVFSIFMAYFSLNIICHIFQIVIYPCYSTFILISSHQQIVTIIVIKTQVDIVLPEEMTVRESHDIGESLQKKIERMPEAERCFVHIDYECDHCPWKEHKIV